MAPPNVDNIIKEIENLNLQALAREQGSYLVFPDTKYPDLEPFKHNDPAARGDPLKASIYKNAEKIFDLTPNIGTEIHGLQLSALTDTQKDDLALLVAERGVVFFRNQDIDIQQGKEFGKYFGPLHIHNVFGHPPGHPELHIVYFDPEIAKTTNLFGSAELGSTRSAADGWHSDVTYEKQPPALTLLKIDTLPHTGGDTLWASGYAAYDRLSAPMKKFLEGLEAFHSGEHQVNRALAVGHISRRNVYTATHPIIRTHPVTGWKSLFVQKEFTRHIVGLSNRESETILNYLFDHISGGVDFQVRFKWEENSVAVWDNRVTCHNAIFDYLDFGKRHGWRVTSQGEAPYFDPNSKSRKQDLQEKAKSA